MHVALCDENEYTHTREKRNAFCMEEDECGKCWIQINYEFMMDNSTIGIAAVYRLCMHILQLSY